MAQTTGARQSEGLKEQAADTAQDAASAAREKASELREQGSAGLRQQFDQRSNQAGSQIRSLAEALRRSGNELDGEGSATVSQVTRQAAAQIERLGGYLEQKRGDELMHDVEAFARRRPWMLAGLGMLAGVAAARFMKASSEQRYGDYRRERGQLPQRTAGASRPQSAAGLGDDAWAREPYAGTR